MRAIATSVIFLVFASSGLQAVLEVDSRQLGSVASNGRTTWNGCKCRKDWDDDFESGSCTSYCCNPDEDPHGEWCMVEDESCEDFLGWGYCRSEGMDLGNCADEPPGWADSEGYTCERYAAEKWCNATGGYGTGWEADWWDFGQYRNLAHSAQTACCNCGGGRRSKAPKDCHGGWAPNLQCELPFRYKGETYEVCATGSDGKGWCSHATEHAGEWSPCYPCKERIEDLRCEDVPDWADSEGDGCGNYIDYAWCAEGGGFGLGWHEEWGTFEEYAFAGHSAATACCECGGGRRSLPVSLPTGADPRTSQMCHDGWAASPQCAHRFAYQGVTYQGCTTVDNDDTGWCSHAAESTRFWSECTPCGGASVGLGSACNDGWVAPPQCSSAFTYQGVTYQGCTTVDGIDGTGWCSHDAIFANARSDCMCGGASSGASSGASGGASSGAISGASALCQDGWAAPAHCSPKFVYEGVTYHGCITVHNDGKGWCSHAEESAEAWSDCAQCGEATCDGSWVCPPATYKPHDAEFVQAWSDCTCVGASSAASFGASSACNDGWSAPSTCVPAFTYQGVTYQGCTTVGNVGKGWCSHAANSTEAWSDCTPCGEVSSGPLFLAPALGKEPLLDPEAAASGGVLRLLFLVAPVGGGIAIAMWCVQKRRAVKAGHAGGLNTCEDL